MSHGEVHALRPEDVHGTHVYVEGAEARHIARVLRHRPGDELQFTIGAGEFLRVRLDRVESGGVHGEILGREMDPREEGAPWLHLGLALLKGDHFDLAVEKAVELGAHEIWPLAAEHCVARWKPAAISKKVGRTVRVAESAMKQSGRSFRAKVHEPRSPQETLRRFRERHGEDAVVLVADEALDAPPPALPRRARSPRLVLVGPEGGFSEREKSDLDAAGAVAFTLGPYRLRAETAAVAAVYTLHRGMQ